MKTKEEATGAAELKTIEAWAEELKTPDWLFAATKTVKAWGIGKEISKVDFESALATTGNLKINP